MEDLIPVHVAVLLITDTHTPADESTVKAVIDRLSTVGHQIVECEVVTDSTQLVRAQFLKWIADSNIDVVIAIAGIETESTRIALQPLITKPLDGFSELVRMISFEEIGTGAMLVDVAAAQCSSTFVFVLPASGGAVRSALDKILIPQLDSRTKPRNLVSRMPRLKSGGLGATVVKAPPAVPVAVKTENTPVVAGVPPPVARIPSKTQIGPGVPPPAPPPRQISQGTAARADWVAPKYVMPPVMPAAKDPPERPAPWITPKSSTATPLGVPIGIERKPAVVALKPAADASTDGGRDEVPIAADPRAASSPPIPVVDPEPAPIPVAAGDPKPASSFVAAASQAVPTLAPAVEPTKTEVVDDAKPAPAKPADPDPARAEPKPITSESSSSATGMALPRKRPKTDPPPLPKSLKAKVLVDDSLPIEDVTDLATLESGPRPAIKAPVPPIDLPKPRAGTEDRVFGDRELAPHRKRRKKSNGLLLLGCLALATSTFLLVLYLGHRDTPTSVAGTRPDQAIARIPTPPPLPEPKPEPVATPDAAEPVVSVDAAEIQEPPPEPVKPTKAPAIVNRDPRTPTRPTTPTDPPTTTTTPEPDDQPKNPPTMPESCDEVSCILEKYARSCCARFKPVDPGPRPIPSGIPEELDKAMIRAGVDKMRPVIIGCGEKAGVHGTVKVAVSVGASGTVDSANVAATPDPTLGDCVVGAMRKITFGKTKTGGSFTYPFVF